MMTKAYDPEKLRSILKMLKRSGVTDTAIAYEMGVSSGLIGIMRNNLDYVVKRPSVIAKVKDFMRKAEGSYKEESESKVETMSKNGMDQMYQYLTETREQLEKTYARVRHLELMMKDLIK